MRLSDLSFNTDYKLDSLVPGNLAKSQKQPTEKQPQTASSSKQSGSQPKKVESKVPKKGNEKSARGNQKGSDFQHDFDFLKIIDSMKAKGPVKPKPSTKRIPLLTNPLNLQPGCSYLPPNLAPDNLRSYSPINLGTEVTQPTTVASPPKRPEDSTITDARSLASAVDNRVEQPLGDTSVEQQKSGAEVSNDEMSSGVSEMINDSIKSMQESPNISLSLSPSKTSSNLGKTYKPKIDQSLILQGKRERKQTKPFVATSVEKRTPRSSEESDQESYEEWLLKRSEKGKKGKRREKKAEHRK